jgi:hypothetical protein
LALPVGLGCYALAAVTTETVFAAAPAEGTV